MRELAPWIERRRRALARAAAEVARTPGTVPYLGAELRLRAGAGPDAGAPRAATSCSCPSATPPRRSSAGTGARRARRSAPRLDAAMARAGVTYTRADDPRPAHPLGVVLGHRRDVVQLAPAARARGGARLRGRARGLPPRGDGPLAALLAAARDSACRTGATTRAGCAATARRWCSEGPAAAPRRRSRRPPARPAGGARGPSTPAPSRRRGRRSPRAGPGPRSSARAATCSRRREAAEAHVDLGPPHRVRRHPRLGLEQLERLLQRVGALLLHARPGPHDHLPAH